MGNQGTLRSGLQSAAAQVLEEIGGLGVEWLFPADDLSTLGRGDPAGRMSCPGAHPEFLKHWGTRSFCCDTSFFVFFFFPQKRHQLLIAPSSFKLHFASGDLCHGQAMSLPRTGRGGNAHSLQGCPLSRGQHSILPRRAGGQQLCSHLAFWMIT